jgi:hypothetical protein
MMKQTQLVKHSQGAETRGKGLGRRCSQKWGQTVDPHAHDQPVINDVNHVHWQSSAHLTTPNNTRQMQEVPPYPQQWQCLTQTVCGHH